MAKLKQNPFPGMNPWLESHWGDVHTRLTTYSCDYLQSQLPRGLRARIEEYVVLESDDDSPLDDRLRYAPDVRVIEQADAPESTESATAVALAEEPLVVKRRSEATLHAIHVVDVESGHRFVTSIEFLSPANKTSGDGRQQFRAKQDNLISGGVNVVEIDLLRIGSWVMSASKMEVPKSRREPYRICVVRARESWKAEVYRVPLRRPLPTIRIPLRKNDADVLLPLQQLLDTAFVNGAYADDLDYSRPPVPPLSADDAAWAEQLLKERKLLPNQHEIPAVE